MLDVRDLSRATREMSSQSRDKSRFVVHGTQHQQYHLSQTRNGKPYRTQRVAAGLYGNSSYNPRNARIARLAPKRNPFDVK